MDDRTLLEKAARAAGITVIGPVEKFVAQFEDRHKGGFIVRNDRGGDSCWNPLTDDGDALRLAVKLGLDITYKAFAAAEVMVSASDDQFDGWFSEPYGNDPCAATRRAIVRAAAAIGEKQ